MPLAGPETARDAPLTADVRLVPDVTRPPLSAVLPPMRLERFDSCELERLVRPLPLPAAARAPPAGEEVDGPVLRLDEEVLVLPERDVLLPELPVLPGVLEPRLDVPEELLPVFPGAPELRPALDELDEDVPDVPDDRPAPPSPPPLERLPELLLVDELDDEEDDDDDEERPPLFALELLLCPPELPPEPSRPPRPCAAMAQRLHLNSCFMGAPRL